ncbi:hypothetical protein HO133_001112 [Letharia lupina]|uniref:Citrate synthase n=1 Tax=Letharia lupina TaxID=560253 RepID=A0A8H6CGP9_9LECA|nr:uncharacterized protein HO133_001112 [Letharia lupina]KAF6223060.1 hypothetical protein HO133_001112 [Letharia lupina]
MTQDMDYLHVLDSRTEKSYKIPIQDNFIQATDVGKITLPDASHEEKNTSVENARPLRLLDQGFENTACMVSSITVIDGHHGEFRFRGLPIEDLFRTYIYEDVMHLLIWEALPSPKQKEDVRTALCQAAIPPETVVNVISAFPQDSETYNMILAGMSAFASSDSIMGATRHQQKPMFQGNLEKADKAIVRTVSYMAATIALVYCHKRGKNFTNPQPHRSLIGNLLLMMGFIDAETSSDSKVEECLNKLWILYADSEITNSTAAALHAGSSLTDPVSCAIAGLVSGFGPLHGGAIELAYEGFEQIGKVENVGPFMEAVKAKKARLFGYGHRVLKKRDPRAALIKEVMPPEDSTNPLLQIAFEVDRAARKDPYFVERGLHANVDLYGSFPYLAL